MSLEESECTNTDVISGLDDEVLTEVFSWIGDGSYLMVGGMNHGFQEIYKRRFGTSTSVEQLVQTVAGAELFLKESRPGLMLFFHMEPHHQRAYTPLDTVAGMAALHGNMDVLEWTVAQGCIFEGRRRDDPFFLAACNGHVHVLEWLFENCSVVNKDALFEIAAYHGQLEVLQWMYDNGWKRNMQWSVCEHAAAGGKLTALQWLRKHGFSWGGLTCSAAAENGHLDVLKWARANGCPWDASACTEAARNGHLFLLQWLRAQGCPWNSHTCWGAAENGHLDVLKWARANGCPWDSSTIEFALQGGHYDVADWARENGFPNDDQDGYLDSFWGRN